MSEGDRTAEFFESLYAGAGDTTRRSRGHDSRRDIARRRFPDSRVTYLVADLFALPSNWQRRFALIVEVQTIQSLPPSEHRAAASAISTCLAPGGRMFLRTSVRGDDEPALSRPWPWPPSSTGSRMMGWS